jgi:excisionase family DNA binding protein
MDIRKDFISTSEAAKILGVSRITVFNKIKTGKIPAMKVGRNFVIRKKDVLKAAGELLTSKQKRGINKAVEKAAKQYGDVFRRLGKE